MAERWISTRAGAHLRGRQSRNTEPELLLRRALHAAGARFRLHRRIVAGCTADLVLPRRQIAVFVDGCWWHGCPRHGRTTGFTGPNAGLWEQKLARTKARDLQATAAAGHAGWHVIRLWECDVRSDPDGAARSVLARPHERDL
jgi:DNA mismatch endonuclease (patch repair protein)